MKLISGIREIADRYTHFVFDVWGVVHDGSKAYPDAVESISFLRQQGKKICFLSNAPRRSSKVAEALKKFGIAANFYDFILTSGEVTFLDLQENQRQGFKKFGQNYLYIGPSKDVDLLSGLNYKMVQDPANAGFVITTGFDHDNSTLEEKLPQVVAAKKYNLPMICVNPDMVVVKQNGHESICAGALAAEYEKIGGEVIYYGKPFPHVYESVCSHFGEVAKADILAIGDGLETDIKGANSFKIDSVIVAGGILAKQLGIINSQSADQTKLKELCDKFQIFPEFVISYLTL